MRSYRLKTLQHEGSGKAVPAHLIGDIPFCLVYSERRRLKDIYEPTPFPFELSPGA